LLLKKNVDKNPTAVMSAADRARSVTNEQSRRCTDRNYNDQSINQSHTTTFAIAPPIHCPEQERWP